MKKVTSSTLIRRGTSKPVVRPKTATRKKASSNSKSKQLKAEIKGLAAMPDEEINTDDIPEIRDWKGAKRGLHYRPIKQQITLRLDADLVNWFKKHAHNDRGYQTDINRALREYVDQHDKRTN